MWIVQCCERVQRELKARGLLTLCVGRKCLQTGYLRRGLSYLSGVSCGLKVEGRVFKAGEAQDDYGSDGGSLSAGNFGAAAHGADPRVFGAGGLGGVLQGLGSSGGHRRTPLASLECPSCTWRRLLALAPALAQE